jgi:chromosome segregation ATPase
MTRRIARRTYPKISTMPRQQTEATAHLEMYKLLVEKQRLEQELQSLDQRQQQIHERLGVLESQVAELEQTATKIERVQSAMVQPAAQPSQAANSFDTWTLEY